MKTVRSSPSTSQSYSFWTRFLLLDVSPISKNPVMIYIPYWFFDIEKTVAIRREGEHGYRVRRRRLKGCRAINRQPGGNFVDASVARTLVLFVQLASRRGGVSVFIRIAALGGDVI